MAYYSVIMQQNIQFHTEFATNLRLDAVQRYVDSLAGSMQPSTMRSGSLISGAHSAYDTEVLDLDKKEGHLLESDIASTRIYPHKHSETLSEMKALLDADTIRPIYESAIEHTVKGGVWVLAASYKVFIMLDSIAERVLRATVATWNTALERIQCELNKETRVFVPAPVSVHIDNGAPLRKERPTTTVIEVLEQPHRPASLDTLVFALGTEEDTSAAVFQECAFSETNVSADAERQKHIAGVESYSETIKNHQIDETDKATTRGVVKALYLNILYGPPHLR
jgi:hypothetical protein